MIPCAPLCTAIAFLVNAPETGIPEGIRLPATKAEASMSRISRMSYGWAKHFTAPSPSKAVQLPDLQNDQPRTALVAGLFGTVW